MASKRRVVKNDLTQEYKSVDGDSTYTGVTSLIGKYKQPFDAVAASIAYAEKHGQTPEYWRRLWEMKWDYRKLIGNTVHATKEAALGGASVGRSSTGKILNVQNANLLLDSGTRISDLPDGIYLEMPLHHHGFGKSGTPDKFILETVDGVRYVDIVDYKTNEKIEEQSYQFKRSGNFKVMQYPLHTLMDCSLVHISLQICTYAYFLECFGFTPRKLLVEHFKYDVNETEILSGRILDITAENAKFEKTYVIDYTEYKEHVVNLLYYEYNARRGEAKKTQKQDEILVSRKL